MIFILEQKNKSFRLGREVEARGDWIADNVTSNKVANSAYPNAMALHADGLPMRVHSVGTVPYTDDYSSSLQNLQGEISCKFSGKKMQSEKLAAVYAYMDLMERMKRVYDCGSYLEFRVTSEKSKLQRANFCKDRLCPMCNWRRSLKIFSQVSSIMDELGDSYEYLFLTLTVKNCSADKLSDTVQALYDGWRYLYHENKEFKTVILGTFRTLEVTRNKDNGTFHPHLHCILAVKKSYFKKGYISQKRWSELWRAACNLEYDPVVFIEKVRNTGTGISGAVCEVAKYSVKGSDFLTLDFERSAEYVSAFLSSLASRRLCGFTGVFTKARQKLQLDDVEDGDLTHVETDSIREDLACMIVKYSWKSGAYIVTNEKTK